MNEPLATDEELAYLVLTGRRFKCLLEIYALMTASPPPAIVRDLDKIIAAQDRARSGSKTPGRTEDRPGDAPDNKPGRGRSADILPPGDN